MLQGMRVLGLIPARGGSKGLPGKNLRALGGKPLLTWSIDAALASDVVDAVVVSTDDQAIAAAALAAGAEVPFLRPARLAADDAKVLDAVLYTADRLSGEGRPFDAVVLLQPTSPLRTSADIDAAVRRWGETGTASVVSVCPAEHSPLLAGTLGENGSMAGFMPPSSAVNRQQLPVFHRLNGAVYVAGVEWLRRNGSFLGDDSFAYVMPVERSVDIDSETDFAFAECLAARRSEA